LKTYNKGSRVFTVLNDKSERIELIPGKFADLDESTALKLQKNYPNEIEAVGSEPEAEPAPVARKPRKAKAENDNSLEL
jgi:hypothetical protein